ncbi:MAG TPA: hypothetical protein DEQ02_04375 [Ruminococcaceae bacterium]|nr:hypothetical protein [Oscillospiraceae bacterium]
MGFNTTLPMREPQNKELAQAGIEYLRQGFYAQAFLLLSESSAEKEPAVKFALGLCYLCADEVDMAISCFEQAIFLIKAFSSSWPKLSENSDVYTRLVKKQICEQSYLLPMSEAYIKHFPQFAKNTVLMSLIHAYCQKGMFDQARELSVGLTGQVFEEFKKKMTDGR